MKLMKNGVSFVIPVYNIKKEFLNVCLNSIITQKTCLDYEIILIDDCSSQSTKDICKKICKKNNKIRLYSLDKNLGVSNARNIGIKNSNYNWICFVDADDWLEENALNIFSKTIELNNSSDLIIFNTNIVKNTKVEVNHFFEGKNVDITDLKLQIIHKNSAKFVPKYNCVGVSWAKLYKKEFLEKNNLSFDINLTRAEDHAFLLNLLSKNPKINCINQIVYNYRKNEYSTVNKYNPNLEFEFLKTLKELKKIIAKNFDENIYWNAYYLRCLSYLSSIISNEIISVHNKEGYIKKIRNIKKLYEVPEFNEAVEKLKKCKLSNKYKLLIQLRYNPTVLFLIYTANKSIKKLGWKNEN